MTMILINNGLNLYWFVTNACLVQPVTLDFNIHEFVLFSSETQTSEFTISGNKLHQRVDTFASN